MRSVVAALLLAIPMLAGCLSPLGGLGAVTPQDYLQSNTYTKWAIEVDTMQGKQPPNDLLGFVQGRLASVADKPDGIQFFSDATLPAESRTWSTKALVDYGNAHLDRKTSGTTVVTHLLFLAGHSDADDNNGKVLGVSIGTDLIIIFTDSVASSCSSVALPPCFDNKPIFRAVVTHEFGHALGLVNNGVAMVKDHEDASHKRHSSNQDSVMYWAVESSDILSILGNGPPTDFDADDRADLHAAGGK